MKKERIFWGIFFIAGAVFLLIGKLGFLGDISALRFLMTALFGALLVKSILNRTIPGILFSAAFLCILWSRLLGIEAITPGPVLAAALLGSIGAGFLTNSKNSWRSNYFKDGESVIESPEGMQMFFETAFGDSVKYVSSEDFKSASLSCKFGATKLYFDNAVIRNQEAVLYLDIAFAGVELFIPKEWKVLIQAGASFGGIDEKNRNAGINSCTLKLVGRVSFGGVEIIYV